MNHSRVNLKKNHFLIETFKRYAFKNITIMANPFADARNKGTQNYENQVAVAKAAQQKDQLIRISKEIQDKLNQFIRLRGEVYNDKHAAFDVFFSKYSGHVDLTTEVFKNNIEQTKEIFHSAYQNQQRLMTIAEYGFPRAIELLDICIRQAKTLKLTKDVISDLKQFKDTLSETAKRLKRIEELNVNEEYLLKGAKNFADMEKFLETWKKETKINHELLKILFNDKLKKAAQNTKAYEKAAAEAKEERIDPLVGVPAGIAAGIFYGVADMRFATLESTLLVIGVVTVIASIGFAVVNMMTHQEAIVKKEAEILQALQAQGI